MFFNLTMASGNRKTGPIPVTISNKDTCPNACPFKGKGCYARLGVLNIHWMKLDKKGLSFDELLDAIKTIPNGRLWRHNQAGDLVGSNDEIDSTALEKLTKANKGKRGFTYTHYDPSIGNNAKAIRKANQNGFTVNLSADNLSEADKFKKMNIGPVVVVLPANQKENMVTPEGNKVVVCPAYDKNVQCMDCQLCHKSERSVIVGFPAHGAGKNQVQNVFNS